MSCSRLCSTSGKRLIDSVNAVLFDCDGVIWNGFGTIDGGVELISKLRDLGKKVIFVTNNSTKSSEKYLEKLEKYGFNAKADDIFATAAVTALYLKNVLKFNKKVYLIGGQGIAEELDNVGIRHYGAGPSLTSTDPNKDAWSKLDLTKDPEVGAVVVGFDEYFSYQKMTTALQYLVDDSIHFIATNMDPRFPLGNGRFTPGTGCFVSAVEVAAQRKSIVMGKPERPMFEAIQSIHHIEAEKTLMIGDRLDTDILFGKRCEMKTLAVLSGVTTIEHLESIKKEGKMELLPDFYTDSVKDVLDHLK